MSDQVILTWPAGPISQELSAQIQKEWLPPDGIAALLRAGLGREFKVRHMVAYSVRPPYVATFKVVADGGNGQEEFGLKIQRRRAEQVFRDWQALFRSADGWQVPTPLAIVAACQCIIYRWVSSPSLTDVFRRDGHTWIRAAAEAMRGLQASPVRLSRSFDVCSALGLVGRCIASAVEGGHPRAKALQGRFAQLERQAHTDEQPLRPGHRDFAPRHVLATDPPTIIDLDAAALTEPSLAVGAFAASLVLKGLGYLVEPWLTATVGEQPALRRRADYYRMTRLARMSAVYWLRGERDQALEVPLE